MDQSVAMDGVATSPSILSVLVALSRSLFLCVCSPLPGCFYLTHTPKCTPLPVTLMSVCLICLSLPLSPSLSLLVALRKRFGVPSAEQVGPTSYLPAPPTLGDNRQPDSVPPDSAGILEPALGRLENQQPIVPRATEEPTASNRGTGSRRMSGSPTTNKRRPFGLFRAVLIGPHFPPETKFFSGFYFSTP